MTRCMLIRGGTSKGAYFLRDDLPEDIAARDELLLRIMGTPDPRQIDGIGGAHPLTSKVAVVAASEDHDADVDYLFLQLGVGEPIVTDRQNCGNLLAGVGPFAIERGLVEVEDGEAVIRIRMVNSDVIAVARLEVRGGAPVYDGDTAISGVPGSAAAVRLDLEGTAGSTTGALLPTGNVTDQVEGVIVTLIDNGMPVVVLAAESLAVTGYESCAELEANDTLRDHLERIRLAAGHAMGLGDVTETTVPKLTMVAPPVAGGNVSTRTFIPHRCHDAIGVLGALSVATACLLPESPAAAMSKLSADATSIILEHPSGALEATASVSFVDGKPVVERAGFTRTARKLMDGVVFPRSY